MAEYHGIVWIDAKTLVSAEMPVLELSATLELLKRVIKEWKIKYHWGFYLKKNPQTLKNQSQNLKRSLKHFETPLTHPRGIDLHAFPPKTLRISGEQIGLQNT